MDAVAEPALIFARRFARDAGLGEPKSGPSTDRGLAAAIVGEVLRRLPGYDAILPDALCSVTGIFRRHPDVLYRASQRIVAESAETQAALLDRASRWLNAGGLPVYAVCSPESEEEEAVAQTFIAGCPDFTPEAIPSRYCLQASLHPPRGWLRVLPGQIADPGGADGFFVACFRRDLVLIAQTVHLIPKFSVQAARLLARFLSLS